MVPHQNFVWDTLSPSEKFINESPTFFPSQNVLGFVVVYDQSHRREEESSLVSPNISLIKLHFFGVISVLYSSGISVTKRLTILLEYVPKVYRSLALVIMSFFFARVMAT